MKTARSARNMKKCIKCPTYTASYNIWQAKQFSTESSTFFVFIFKNMNLHKSPPSIYGVKIYEPDLNGGTW